LGAKVESTKIDLDLLRCPPAADELIALGYQCVSQILVHLSQVRLPSQQLRKARRLLERPGHLQLFPVYDAPLPVWYRSTFIEDVAAQLPLLEDIRPGAGRLRLVPHFSFFVPLRLAENHDVCRTRV